MEKKISREPRGKGSSDVSRPGEDSYRLAKLIRQGERELERQYNTKKTRRQR